jgi:hypothetical protein
MERNEDYAWEVSPTAWEEYRKLAPSIRFYPESMFFNYSLGAAAGEELYGPLTRYADGQMKMEDALREIDKKLRMIYMESR